MLIRLTRKLAECVDGVDLSRAREGDVLDLSPREGELLIAEGWAETCDAPRPAEAVGSPPATASADSAARLTAEQLRRVREQMEQRMFEQQQERRLEDRIREELHDAHARILPPTERDEPV
jgi:hypothetical protein